MGFRFLSADRYNEKDWKKIVLFLWLGGLSAIGFVVLTLYSVYRGMQDAPVWSSHQFPAHFLDVLGSSFMVGLASLAAGALVGFLFGVPRYRTEQSTPTTAQAASNLTASGLPRYIPNTNLEQISDWLTKYLWVQPSCNCRKYLLCLLGSDGTFRWHPSTNTLP